MEDVIFFVSHIGVYVYTVESIQLVKRINRITNVTTKLCVVKTTLSSLHVIIDFQNKISDLNFLKLKVLLVSQYRHGVHL